MNGGKLLFEINGAHTKSVSTITITNDDSKLISGGCDGQVYIHLRFFFLNIYFFIGIKFKFLIFWLDICLGANMGCKIRNTIFTASFKRT